MIKIIVVDDHPLFRIGIKSIFKEGNNDIVVIGEAECGSELFKLLAYSVPDMILLDINLPDVSGVEIAYRLKKEYPAIKILAVSAENTAETVKAMLDAGINGFISKRKSGTAELAEAIHSVMNGLEYFGRDISAIMYDIFISKKKTTIIPSEFTDREREIMLACRDGLLSKEIAARLKISINTVNTHKKNILQKLGINNTMEMVQYALKNGIIRVEMW
jgi:DNA-binding NarL/FixJ family response regulator